METSTRGAIVVGVTGPGRETPALRWAAETARREGAEVVLLHAYRASFPSPPPSVLLSRAEAADVAGRIIKEVGEEFGQLTGGTVEFRGLALPGAPVRVLVELGRDARMIVVQHRPSHGLGRLFVGSTAHGAAAHADCPLVSVPTDWEPGPTPGEVVVGVHEGGVPRQVLSTAFAWAAATGAPLRVSHGWRLDSAYDDIITARVAAEWRDEQKRVLAGAVDELQEGSPTVPVALEVRHQWPSDILVDDSRTASLVVVGRHDTHGWPGERLGSVARTVLREATSPVMVVPVHSVGEAPQDWDLVADEISPQT